MYILGLGLSAVHLSAMVIIQKMFHKNRTLASGTTLTGMALGEMAGPLIMEYLAEKYGWRGSILIISGLLSHMIPVCLMFPSFEVEQRNVQSYINIADEIGKSRVFKENHNSASCIVWKKSDFSLMRNCTFLLFCISFMCDTFSYYTFLDHMIGRGSTHGLSHNKGAYLVSSIAVGSLATRIICSFVGNLNCCNCLVIFTMGLFLATLCSFVITFTTEFKGMLMCTIIQGVHCGW